MTPRAASSLAAAALLAFRGRGALAVGAERIAMLEAVAAHGSITAAAKALGISYKTVWDGVNTVNNLLPQPALQTKSGGRGGGGATLTPSGEHLISTFHRLQAKLDAIAASLGRGEADSLLELLFWTQAMQTSARNVLLCRVCAINRSPVSAEVTLEVAPGRRITAVVTTRSADALGLTPGLNVLALIKATFVLLAPRGEAARVSVANRIDGEVLSRTDDGVNSEITVAIGDGKTLTAVITRRSAEALSLCEGRTVTALFDAAHVILAVG